MRLVFDKRKKSVFEGKRVDFGRKKVHFEISIHKNPIKSIECSFASDWKIPAKLKS